MADSKPTRFTPVRRAPPAPAPAPQAPPAPPPSPAPEPEPAPVREVPLRESGEGLAAIRIEGLRRLYGKTLALEGASFQVQHGEVFGFLGPNGAGKTTCMRIVAGLLRAHGGQAWVDGEQVGPDKPEAKARLGYAPEEPAYPRQLKALPLLVAYASFHDIPKEVATGRAVELLNLVGLADAADKKMGAFSHGMRKRYSLAQALLHDPPVLLLDEPTAGMDPAAQAWFRGFVRSLAQQGKGVLLSTHLLHEASQVCDRVAVVHKGKVIAVDSPAALTARMQRVSSVVIEAQAPEGAEDALRKVPGVRAVQRQGARFQVEVERPDAASEAVAALVAAGGKVARVESGAPTLEDVFLQLTGGSP